MRLEIGNHPFAVLLPYTVRTTQWVILLMYLPAYSDKTTSHCSWSHLHMSQNSHSKSYLQLPLYIKPISLDNLDDGRIGTPSRVDYSHWIQEVSDSEVIRHRHRAASRYHKYSFVLRNYTTNRKLPIVNSSKNWLSVFGSSMIGEKSKFAMPNPF